MPTDITTIIIASVVALVLVVLTGIICFSAGVAHRKRIAEAAIGSAEQEAKRVIENALKSASAKKKEALLEAKDEILLQRSEADKEIKARHSELSRQERRLQQKEEALDRKFENMERREEAVQEKIAQADIKLKDAEECRVKQLEILQEISGYTKEQAKEQLLSSMDGELIHEKALRLQQHEQQIKEEADQRARNIIASAIQRCATESVAELTVSVVNLPSEEIKGRIIGREGRNIRTLETLTGVDIIIDDTPEAITLSCHDPVKREVAKIAIEKLISDGRIHPARIEETVERAAREIEQRIKADGEKALIETGVHNVHPDLVRLLGRMRYRTSYGQNVLTHSIEVAHIAGIMANELGVDAAVARRAGLLHDIGKALTREVEGSHVEIGAELAKRYKEHKEVLLGILSHHGDVEPSTITAVIVQAADAISAARPGARRENLENYIKRIEKLENIATSFDGVDKCFAIQAGREIRIMLNPEVLSDEAMVITARDIAKRIEDELEYPGQIKVNLIRETRAIEYAR